MTSKCCASIAVPKQGRSDQSGWVAFDRCLLALLKQLNDSMIPNKCTLRYLRIRCGVWNQGCHLQPPKLLGLVPIENGCALSMYLGLILWGPPSETLHTLYTRHHSPHFENHFGLISDPYRSFVLHRALRKLAWWFSGMQLLGRRWHDYLPTRRSWWIAIALPCWMRKHRKHMQ